jgi:hypothetical protein
MPRVNFWTKRQSAPNADPHWMWMVWRAQRDVAQLNEMKQTFYLAVGVLAVLPLWLWVVIK